MKKVTSCPASVTPATGCLERSWAAQQRRPTNKGRDALPRVLDQMKPETLLIFADSERDANMLYATGLFVPDPFVYLNIRGRTLLVMSDLEIDRTRVQAPHCQVVSLSDHQKKECRVGKECRSRWSAYH